MDRRHQLVFGTLLCVSAAVARAEDPLKVLEDKGLKKTSSNFVVDGEKELADKSRSIRTVQRKLMSAERGVEFAEKRAESEKKLIKAIIKERMAARRQLERTTTVEEYNKIVNYMNELYDRARLIEEESDKAKAVKKARADYTGARDDFLKLILEMRGVADAVEAAYAKLADDERVTSAIAAYNQTATRKLELGPSRIFKSNLRKLEDAEEKVHRKEIVLRTEGNIHWLDVTLNGSTTKPFVLDSGASLVSLPHAVASQIGLTPKGEPDLILVLADGRKIEAWQMTIDKITVGEFEVEDVNCAVLPNTMTNADPLLGGTFLRHFTYRIDPAGSKLTLTKVDAGGKRR